MAIKETDSGAYTYDSVLELDLGSKASWEVNIPIGTTYSEEFAVVPDPFQQHGDSAVEVHAVDGELLMSVGRLEDNTINVCSAADVLPLHMSSLPYYPLLNSKDITTIEEYNANKSNLVEATKSLVTNPIFKRVTNSIGLLKEISSLPLPDGEAHQNMGIKKGRITLHPQATFALR